MSKIDWLRLARQLMAEQTTSTYYPTHPDGSLDRAEFLAEALRRTFGFSANDGTDGRRELPYETLGRHVTGLTTVAAADYLRESHTIIDRLNTRAAKEEAAAARAETRRVLEESARDLAKYIRGWANHRVVPSRYRREGVLIASAWLDPDNPATPSDYQVPDAPDWPAHLGRG
jgi:hypothetical protein